MPQFRHGNPPSRKAQFLPRISSILPSAPVGTVNSGQDDARLMTPFGFSRVKTFSVEHEHNFNPHLLNNLRFRYSSTDTYTGPDRLLSNYARVRVNQSEPRRSRRRACRGDLGRLPADRV